MAGLGRRSHYRKHLTDTVLNEYPEPDYDAGDYVAQVQSSRGGNLFDLLVATTATANSNNKSQLAMLPTKYHKLVWIKRGDYVIVQSGDDITQETQEARSNSGIRYIIKNILYKKQITHLKERQLWPQLFDTGEEESADKHTKAKENDDILRAKAKEIIHFNNDNDHVDDDVNEYLDDDEYYTSEAEEDDDFMVNTNRIAAMQIHDSSSDDDSD